LQKISENIYEKSEIKDMTYVQTTEYKYKTRFDKKTVKRILKEYRCHADIQIHTYASDALRDIEFLNKKDIYPGLKFELLSTIILNISYLIWLRNRVVKADWLEFDRLDKFHRIRPNYGRVNFIDRPNWVLDILENAGDTMGMSSGDAPPFIPRLIPPPNGSPISDLESNVGAE